MPKGIIVLIVILALIVGGAILLSSRVKQQPTHTIEANVAANAAG